MAILGGGILAIVGFGCCFLLSAVLLVTLILWLLRRQEAGTVSAVPPKPQVQGAVRYPTAADIPPRAEAPKPAPPESEHETTPEDHA